MLSLVCDAILLCVILDKDILLWCDKKILFNDEFLD